MREVAGATEPGRSRRALVAVLALVLALAWIARSPDGLRRRYAEAPGVPPELVGRSYTSGTDGHYHMRRVARALADGPPVAESDPYLSYPDGSAIPWPPYYDLALWAALAPFAPDESGSPARRSFVERAVSSAPRLFGVGTSALAALAGWTLGGAPAALFAGAHHALSFGSINYSIVGNGDHHAWVSFWSGVLLLGATAAFRGQGLSDARRGAAWGVLLGAVAGLAIGSWVAALLYVLQLELALAWLLVRRGRTPMPGLAPLGLSAHLAALAVLLPAVLSSPWKERWPWMVVNLSWFHAAFLALGALVFVPPLAGERGFLASGTRAARLYPALVALALSSLAALLSALDLGPARGLREGFEWVSREDRFMAVVQESWGLLDPRGRGWEDLFLALGYLGPAAALAWAWLAWRALRRGEHALLPWVVALPPLAVQTFQQRRFADALVLPLAVVLGLGVAGLLRRVSGPRWIAPGLALALALASQTATVARTARAWRRTLDPQLASPGATDWSLGQRRALEWIASAARDPEDPAVMAHWDDGHDLEWIADRPTVATNFGSYVGPESFLDPPRFFLGRDPREAEALLERRGAGLVYVPADLPRNARTQAALLGIPDLAGSPAYRETMASRLLNGGLPTDASGRPTGDSLDFLRLVYVSPIRAGSPTAPPSAWIWERVPGVTLEAQGAPGDELALALDVTYLDGAFGLRWSGRATAGEDGLALLRVPYATRGANGEGRAAGPARWTFAGRSGELVVPARAVERGERLRLP